MRDVDQDIRSSLERLTDPQGSTPGTGALWSDLVARRRRRRDRSRALAALPVLFVAVLAAGILSLQGSGDARSDVAAGDDERSEGPQDFAPFEMTFRTLSYQGGEVVPSTWKLTYESWTDWETTLVDGGRGVAEEPGFRRALRDGTLTEYNPDGTVRLEERVDGRLAPLALMSRGPRTGKAEGGDSDSTYQHEYTSTQEHECPEDPAQGGPYCEQPGETAVVETVERYNSDGVPVFAEERIAASGRVVWQFETLTYEQLNTVDDPTTGSERSSAAHDCPDPAPPEDQDPDPPVKLVVLSGDFGGEPWCLSVSESDGLGPCISIKGGAAPEGQQLSSGACDGDLSAFNWHVTGHPEPGLVVYGHAPANATEVRFFAAGLGPVVVEARPAPEMSDATFFASRLPHGFVPEHAAAYAGQEEIGRKDALSTDSGD